MMGVGIPDLPDDSGEEQAADEPVELWMQSEEQTSQNDSASFDSSDMAKLRRKLKAKNDDQGAVHLYALVHHNFFVNLQICAVFKCESDEIDVLE